MADILNERGYVVYSKNWKPEFEKTSYWGVYWEKIRAEKEEQVKSLYSLVQRSDLIKELSNLKTIGRHLITLGEAERKKELNLIKKVFGDNISLSTEEEVIKHFNEVLTGAGNYKKALEQITLAEKVYKESGRKKQGKSQLAPVLSSLFLSEFTTIFHHRLKNLLFQHQEEVMNGDASFWESRYEQIITESADQALTKLLKTKGVAKNEPDIFGRLEKHLELFEDYTKNKDVFFKIVNSKIGMESLRNIITNNLKIIQDKLKNSKPSDNIGTSVWVKKAVGNIQGSIGGSVNEFLNALAMGMVPKEVTIENGKKGKKAAVVFSNEVQKTDNAVLFSFDANVDVGAIVKEFDKEMQKTLNLSGAAKKMQEYYDNHLKNLNDSFIVFTSNKAYGFNKRNKKGFEGGKGRGVGGLIDVLSINNPGRRQSAENFIEVVVNAMPGAVLQDERDDIKGLLRNAIYCSMASLLFDDWIMIGQQEAGDTNAIHAFTLNNIQIPLSFLLMSAGKVIEEASSIVGAEEWFEASINFPEILYHTSNDYPLKSHKDGKRPDVVKAWEEQRKKATTMVNFTYHFLQNFYDEINKLAVMELK